MPALSTGHRPRKYSPYYYYYDGLPNAHSNSTWHRLCPAHRFARPHFHLRPPFPTRTILLDAKLRRIAIVTACPRSSSHLHSDTCTQPIPPYFGACPSLSTTHNLPTRSQTQIPNRVSTTHGTPMHTLPLLTFRSDVSCTSTFTSTQLPLAPIRDALSGVAIIIPSHALNELGFSILVTTLWKVSLSGSKRTRL